jgi:hypothetical protein
MHTGFNQPQQAASRHVLVVGWTAAWRHVRQRCEL